MLMCAGVSVMKVAHKNDIAVYFAIIATEAYEIAAVESK